MQKSNNWRNMINLNTVSRSNKKTLVEKSNVPIHF